jgi:hypothetical protein
MAAGRQSHPGAAPAAGPERLGNEGIYAPVHQPGRGAFRIGDKVVCHPRGWAARPASVPLFHGNAREIGYCFEYGYSPGASDAPRCGGRQGRQQCAWPAKDLNFR